MTATPYYADDTVTLYLGKCEDILPTLGRTFDCAVADPPYGETSLDWDRWPDGWPTMLTAYTNSLWCFGSMRMFLDRRDEFADWRLSQDLIGVDQAGAPVYGDVTVVWEKHNGTGFSADRFKRVHEHVLHWYRGHWGGGHHEVPRVAAMFNAKGRTTSAVGANRVGHAGEVGGVVYVDDGTRLMRSVLRVPSVRGGITRTEKPVDLLDPLIRYACPPGGVVLDPFAGSASTAVAARLSGRRAVLIERYEPYAEKAAERLSQTVLPLEVC